MKGGCIYYVCVCFLEKTRDLTIFNTFGGFASASYEISDVVQMVVYSYGCVAKWETRSSYFNREHDPEKFGGSLVLFSLRQAHVWRNHEKSWHMMEYDPRYGDSTAPLWINIQTHVD